MNFKVGFDDELLSALRKAGCFSLFIGFESLNEQTLYSMKKFMNSPSKYAESIANIRHHGMEVYYSTIIGGEFDGQTAGGELADYIEKNNIYYVWPNILTPHPGTKLRDRFEREGCMISADTNCYNQQKVVFKPARLEPDELQKMYDNLCGRVYNFDSLLRRAENLLVTPQRLRLTVFWRIATYLWFLIAALFFCLKRYISVKCFFKSLSVAHRFILLKGTLVSIDMLVYALEMESFSRGNSSCK